jgi:glycosyltransferase involved in cell wall biosynthesis
MSNSIYRFTIFDSDSFGHGGEKRTAQISEILLEKGIASERVPTGMDTAGFSFSNLKKRIIALRYFIKVFKIIGWKFHPKKFYKTIGLVSQFKGVFNLPKNKTSNVILLEASRMEYSFIIPEFKRLGLKIIAIPHNIESFVPGLRSGITNKMSPEWFMEEVGLLKECDIVFAISKEDTLLLKQMGVKVEYLPYYPTKTTLEYLVKIRVARGERTNKDVKRKKVLMLGSAINHPTKEGMVERVKFFREHIEICCDLFVAGYGTDKLECFLETDDNIKLLGELTENQLSEILMETDILLIHQPPTSGALTRIIETLIAGIPIVANFVASRNYFGTNGLYVYYDDKQLINYLETVNFPVPEIPEKPMHQITMFQNTILKFISSE